MKEKIKLWWKKNWKYVAGGAAVAAAFGTVIYAIVNGEDSDVIDPIVIDKGTDDWMNTLTVPYTYNDANMTINQLAAVAAIDNNMHRVLVEEGILTADLEAKINDAWCNKFPKLAKYLDEIPNFWDTPNK